MVFHLSRRTGGPLLVHPFTSTASVFKYLRAGAVQGRYGADPQVEALNLLRNELHHRTDRAVDDWIADIRFIPRFLLSAALFVVAYFFFSFVVRDPLPMLDEMILSAAAAVAAYVLLGRRYKISDTAVRKRSELRSAVDGIVFNESPFIQAVEAYLDRLDGIESEGAIRRWLESPFVLAPEWREEAAALASSLAQNAAPKNARILVRRLELLRRDRTRGSLQGLSRFTRAKKVDLPLVLLSRDLTESIRI